MSVTTFLCRTLPMAVVAIALLAGSAAAGLIFTTESGNGADTYVTNDSLRAPTTVHGTEGAVNVRNLVNTRARVALLRFDLSKATGGSLTGAQLEVFKTASPNTRTLTVYGLIDGHAGEMWDEATTNYLNAPGIDLTAPPHVDADGNYHLDMTDMYGGAPLGTWVFNAGTGIDTSETATLNLDAFLAANTANDVVTFLIAHDGGDGKDYWFEAKEGTVNPAPALILPNAVPEPTSLALAMVGLAAVGLLRRR